MSHASNRKGVFNSPVDPKALGLFDYHAIISNPMDLGTVKNRLHAFTYDDAEGFAADVRLTFENAMRYNPPANPIHLAAKSLHEIFERGFSTIMKERETKLELRKAMEDNQAQEKINSFRSDGVDIAEEVNENKTTLLQSLQPSTMNQTINSTPPSSTVSAHVSSSLLSSISNRSNKRKSSCTRPKAHSCGSCLGSICVLCEDGCLTLEPTFIICSGHNCGQKVRKNAIYYVSRDGACFFCQKCYSNLSAVLPSLGGEDDLPDNDCVDVTEASRVIVRYKRDLLKRRNDEEIVEPWITCTQCRKRMHQTCAMFIPIEGNSTKLNEDKFTCPLCIREGWQAYNGFNGEDNTQEGKDNMGEENPSKMLRTFLSGKLIPSTLPIPSEPNTTYSKYSAAALPNCNLAEFIECKVRDCMVASGCADGEEQTITVRVISNAEREFRVPGVIRRHFQMEASNISSKGFDHANKSKNEDLKSRRKYFPVPATVTYTSKAIMLFQRIDGVDVCVYCMYVHEYDQLETVEKVDSSPISRSRSLCRKRVYIAYLDSVEHFRPRKCRSAVYQEVLVAYLASARLRGYETAHIWVCPPARGNCFIFWAHPPQQRTPTHDRLLSWYHKALARCIETGTITDIKSLHEASFARNESAQVDPSIALEGIGKTTSVYNRKAVCPPLLDGDFWIEEAVKVYKASITRHLKGSTRVTQKTVMFDSAIKMELEWGKSSCPVAHLISMLEIKVLAHPSSMAFRRPVNAAALGLLDYHSIIKKPMDLGTIHGKCLLGEYDTLQDLCQDLELVFLNAMRYNPPGHFVHKLAVEVRDMCYLELVELCKYWSEYSVVTADGDCKSFVDKIEVNSENPLKERSCKDIVKSYFEISLRLGSTIQRKVVNKDALSNGIAEVTFPTEPSEPVVPHTSTLLATSQSGNTAKTNSPSSVDKAPNHMDLLPSESPLPPQMCDDLEGDTGSGMFQMELTTTPTLVHPSNSKHLAMAASLAARTKYKIDNNAGKNPKKLVTLKSSVSKVMSSGGRRKKKIVKLNLLTDGPGAIAQRMLGEDADVSDKKLRQAGGGNKKKKKVDPVPMCADGSTGGPQIKKESWLGDEVGSAVRKMRSDFFVCELSPKAEVDMSEIEKRKARDFELYSKGCSSEDGISVTSFMDARHSLLEFSQYKGYQFDTLRRAKYSTSMLLFHLHNPLAPGLNPTCSECLLEISNVRWHKTKGEYKVDLCETCFAGANDNDNFIPLRVSCRKRNHANTSHTCASKQ